MKSFSQFITELSKETLQSYHKAAVKVNQNLHTKIKNEYKKDKEDRNKPKIKDLERKQYNKALYLRKSKRKINRLNKKENENI